MKQNQNQKALNLLLEATKLQPNISKYHHKYALCLRDIGQIDQADKAFHIAMKIENYEKIDYLYDYAMFLSHCKHDCEHALKYLAMALKCTQDPLYSSKYKFIQQKYDNLYQKQK
eukprot:423170_1